MYSKYIFTINVIYIYIYYIQTINSNISLPTVRVGLGTFRITCYCDIMMCCLSLCGRVQVEISANDGKPLDDWSLEKDSVVNWH